ncbi:ribosome maturation factor RimP [Texcoconibacillus texcoconensis]|uniref:Ribosome maturation factor RimP n=1 Tax=Texcoconibacillus texcoconensis TaxID=1095777 RepID=A0A840QJ27_9BACI|nr:ribosome maturation factor RimP [Texcoconibacillus texcoconensis]MBB5172038.1 ribosome maturation factor RimP [Texcoconibacillus texcoconensis]
MGKNITALVEEIAQPIVEDMGMEIVEVKYQKEGKNWFLRVYIDREGGVDLDDCTAVSERLSEELDKKDPIEGAYFLEVSSPGAERPLKKETDVEKAVGKNVYITTYAPVEGEKVFEGTLNSFDGTTLTVEMKQKQRVKQVEIPYDQVASARLAVVF